MSISKKRKQLIPKANNMVTKGSAKQGRDQLPTEFPIFPLKGLLLLPGMWLPLHFFERRYRNMIRDALKAEGYIGIIQPFQQEDGLAVAEEEETGDLAAEDVVITAGVGEGNKRLGLPSTQMPPLYEVGCLGQIAGNEQTADGRYLVVLHGLKRFQLEEEMPTWKGYRRVRANFSAFVQDADELDTELELAPLLEQLKQFADDKQLNLTMEDLEELPPAAVVNGLSMSLPFRAEEKQGLLEAPLVQARLAKLVTLLKMESAAPLLKKRRVVRIN